MPSADEVKQSITNWCSSDDDLEITSDRFEPGTDFAFGLKSGTLSSSPVDLVVLKGDGADRVTIRRSLTLSGDNVSAANQLIASRPGSVTAAVERSGADTTVVAQTYVYLDGLSKHTFVQAVAELARTSTLLDAIGPEVVDDRRRHRPCRHAGRRHDDRQRLGHGCGSRSRRRPAAARSAAGCRGRRARRVETRRPRSAHPPPSGRSAADPDPARSRSPQPLPRRASRRSRCSSPSQAQPCRTPRSRRSSRTRPSRSRRSPCRSRRPRAQWVPSHSVPPQGLRAWSAPDPVRARRREPRPRAADPGRRGPRCVGARDLLERLDRLDRRTHHRRRCLTIALR